MKDLGVLLNLREPSLLPSTVSLAELVDAQVVNQTEVVLWLLPSPGFVAEVVDTHDVIPREVMLLLLASTVVAMRAAQVVTQREVMLVAMPEYGVFVFKE